MGHKRTCDSAGADLPPPRRDRRRPRPDALVTARVEAESGALAALLEMAIAPTPLTSDDSIA
jgi:hypothetical protein